MKLEVAELQKDVSAIKEGSGGGKEKVNPVELASDVAELQKQVQSEREEVDACGAYVLDREQCLLKFFLYFQSLVVSDLQIVLNFVTSRIPLVTKTDTPRHVDWITTRSDEVGWFPVIPT